MTDALLARIRALPGLEEAPSQWTGGPAFWVDGREIVHLHEGLVEIRLTSRVIARVDDERVMRRSRTSDWVMVRVGDLDLAAELTRQAIEANRRP